MIVFSIEQMEQADDGRFLVSLASATEMSFEIEIGDVGKYDELISDLCHLAPILLQYDADLMEAYDDAFRTKPKKEHSQSITRFLMKYRSRIHNAEMPFDEFRNTGRRDG